MGLDLVTSWVVSYFGSVAVGGLLGWLVGRGTRAELGLGVGMLVPGVVSLGFTVALTLAYREFTSDPHRTTGAVVAVEDRAVTASGNVTTPVAVVRFAGPRGREYDVDAPGGSLHVGDQVAVVYDPQIPGRARTAKPDELRGGAIASMLFGTFPASGAIFFLFGELYAARTPRPRRRPTGWKATVGERLTVAANALILLGLLFPAFSGRSTEELFMIAFSSASIGLWIHCAAGLLRGADPRWAAGVAVVAVNFSAWVVAMYLLFGDTLGATATQG